MKAQERSISLRRTECQERVFYAVKRKRSLYLDRHAVKNGKGTKQRASFYMYFIVFEVVELNTEPCMYFYTAARTSGLVKMFVVSVTLFCICLVSQIYWEKYESCTSEGDYVNGSPGYVSRDI